jgi:site-specific DNA-adenine methylase
MKRQVTSILLFSALVLGGASTFVSCKDTESDAAYEAQAQANKTIAQLIAQQAKDVEELNGKLDRIKQCSCTDEHTNELIEQQIASNNKVIAELKRQMTDNITNDQAVKNAIATLSKQTILGSYADLNTAIQNSQAYKDIMLKLAGNNSELADSVKTIWGDLYGDTETGKVGITKKVDQLLEEMAYTKALAKADSQRIDTLSARLYTEIENATNKVVDMIPTDEDINHLIGSQLADYYTKTQIDSKIKGLQGQIDTLKNSVDDILNLQVSGITIQASESPITGYENTPFGVQVNFLGAYYGHADEGVMFAGQKLASTLISDADDNAGIIYVTVNPANVAPSAIHLKLVDSQGNEAPYKLKWANTDKILTAGVSRAVSTSKNGFYAVKVSLDEDSLNKAKVWTSEDAQKLKSVGKNLLDKLRHPKSTNLQLGNIASTINSTFNNRLKLYAVEATWSQRGLDGKLVDKKVTSAYKLAASPMSPLSFTFLEDGINVDLPSIPTLEQKGLRLERFNTIKVDGMDNMHVNTTATISGIPTSVTIDGTVVPTAQIVEKYPTRVLPNGTVDLSGLDVKVGDVNLGNNVVVTLHKGNLENVGVTMDVPMDDFNAIIKDLNSQIDNMVGNVNNYIDKVNKFEETIDGQLINRINTYINKFENLLTKSNSLLQPAMFYRTNGGSFGQLARVAEGASYLKLNGSEASTVFVASSYTAELLAPAYMKEISVDGGATLTAAGQSGSKVVLKNGQYKVGFKATQAGVYTITYNAVDYFGKTPVSKSKKFYVKVVK